MMRFTKATTVATNNKTCFAASIQGRALWNSVQQQQQQQQVPPSTLGSSKRSFSLTTTTTSVKQNPRCHSSVLSLDFHQNRHGTKQLLQHWHKQQGYHSLVAITMFNSPLSVTTTTTGPVLSSLHNNNYHHQQQVRFVKRRSDDGFDSDDYNERVTKLESRQKKSTFHQKKVDENKKKRETLHSASADTKKKHHGKNNDEYGTEEEDDDDDKKKKMKQHDDEDSDDEEDDGGDGDSGPVLPDPKKVKERMAKVVTAMEKSMQSLRGAEPTPELLENIRVLAYGEYMGLGSVAQVVIVSPTMAHVSCFDPSTVKDVRAALMESALDLNPYLDEMDETTLIVPLPRLSLETRQKMVQQLQRQAEASRTKIRRIRQKAIDVCNKGRQGKLEHISKDDAFRIGKDVESATQDAIAKLNAKVEQKTKSLLQV